MIQALTPQQIAGVIADCNTAISSGQWVAQWTRVKSELSANPSVYSYGDADIIEAAKEQFYGGGNTDMSLKAYLNIIDQRDPATNQPLPAGDRRWVYIGAAPVSAPPANLSANAASVVAALAEMGVYVEQNKLGIGIRPDGSASAQIGRAHV